MDDTIYFSMPVGILLHKALIWTNGLVGYLPPDTSNTSLVPIQTPKEETTTWQANLQGIQNLMGFVADMVTTLQEQASSINTSHLSSKSVYQYRNG